VIGVFLGPFVVDSADGPPVALAIIPTDV